MNLNTTKFFNSTDVNISSRMNEYLKKNFGYEVEGDIDTLQEAKKSLELEQIELKKDGYMNQKYMENMLMIETISSLLKAHGQTSDKIVANEERVDEILPVVGAALGAVGRAVAGGVAKAAGGAVANAVSNAASNSVNASKKSKYKKKLNAVKEEEVSEDEEEKGPDHYRWKNDSQLSIAKDKLEQTMAQLVDAINYREDNKRNLMGNGDKAGSGDLYKMLDTLKQLHDNWDENTKYYGM